FDLNQTVYSVMSYNNGWLTKPGGAPAGNFYNHGYARTFGTIDIAALQAMYGTNTTHAGGNDVYSLATANGQGVGYSAIWDTGGTDEIRYDGAADANLDLRAATLRSEVGGGGYISYSDGVYDGFTIANGVEIENATSGSGNDRLTGNGLANTLNAGGGDDTIIAGEGDDWLIGGAGSDALDGQGGTDTVDYSAEAAGVNVALDGSFTNSGAAAGDTLTSIENVTGTAQDDNLFGDAEGNLLIGGNGNDVLVGNGGADTLRGGDGFDQLIGTDGGAGDVLDGGGGRNLASYAGAGEAQSVNLSDRQDSATNSGENTADTWISITGVIGATNFANTLIGDDGSNDFIGGLQADVFYGGGDIDAMVGLAGDDLFYGGAGNDVLIAGAGTDTLFGEAGADVFYVEPGDGENIIADWVEADDFFLFYQTSLTSWSELTFLEIDLGAGQVNTEITADLLPGVKVTVLGVGEDALDDAGNFFFV
ncbi:MAG: calcium-binding protein, partial [Pseudomonadota bacterium]